VTRGEGEATTEYEYDEKGQLVQAGARRYEYDENGNRCQLLSVETTCPWETEIVYDEQDRLLRYRGVEYSYTDRGALYQKSEAGEITTYTHDPLGNLTRVQGTPSGTIHYTIDGFGRRVAKQVNATLTSQYVWSGSLRIAAELDGAGQVVSRFIYGNKVNVPELVVRPQEGNKVYRVITDHLGSPVYVVNVADPEDVLLDAEYDEWGRITAYSVNGVADGEWPIPFGFAGGLYDEDTGLVRFGARDYDPEIGRWTSKDPILFGGGQANLYVYAHNDPVNFTDPEGKAVPLVLLGGLFFGGELTVGGAAAWFAGGAGALWAAANWETLNPGNWFARKADTRQVDQIARDLGLPRELVRNAIEKIKKAAGLRPNENVDLLPDGTVRDPVSGDDIGHIEDEACGKR
jgi:RHS repeat-associated protein